MDASCLGVQMGRSVIDGREYSSGNGYVLARRVMDTSNASSRISVGQCWRLIAGRGLIQLRTWDRAVRILDGWGEGGATWWRESAVRMRKRV